MAAISTRQLHKLRRRYYGDGWSMREIAEAYGVSVGAVYYFMRKNKLQRRLRHESNTLQFLRREASYILPTRLTSQQEELRLIAVSLYWSEGSKRGKIVDFANSDVQMCILFMRFLREVCQINEKKLRGFIYCHEGQNTKKLIQFWSQVLSIPIRQFTKPYIRSVKVTDAHRREHRMAYGLVHIRYGDLKLLRQIIQWIHELIIQQWAGTRVVKWGRLSDRQPSMETSG